MDEEYNCTQALFSESEEENSFVLEKKQVATLEVGGVHHPVFSGSNVVGRNREKCSIFIDSQSISGEHAVIEVDAVDSHLLSDTGSRNRTRLGRILLKPHVRYQLKHGDVVQIADRKGIYHVLQLKDDTGLDPGNISTSSEEFVFDTPARPRKPNPHPEDTKKSPLMFDDSALENSFRDTPLVQKCGETDTAKKKRKKVTFEMPHSGDSCDPKDISVEDQRHSIPSEEESKELPGVSSLPKEYEAKSIYEAETQAELSAGDIYEMDTQCGELSLDNSAIDTTSKSDGNKESFYISDTQEELNGSRNPHDSIIIPATPTPSESSLRLVYDTDQSMNESLESNTKQATTFAPAKEIDHTPLTKNDEEIYGAETQLVDNDEIPSTRYIDTKALFTVSEQECKINPENSSSKQSKEVDTPDSKKNIEAVCGTDPVQDNDVANGIYSAAKETSSAGKVKEEEIDDIFNAATQLINPVKNIEDSNTDEKGASCSLNQKAYASCKDAENYGTDIYSAETQKLNLPVPEVSHETANEPTPFTRKIKEEKSYDIYSATTQLIGSVKNSEDSDTDEEGAFCSVNQIACTSYKDAENDGTDFYNAETQKLDLRDPEASKKTVDEETPSTRKGKEHTTDIYDATTQLINPVKDNEDSDTDEEGAFCSINQIACASNKDSDIYSAKTQLLDLPDSEASHETLKEQGPFTRKMKEQKTYDIYSATTQLIDPVTSINDSNTDEKGASCSLNQKVCASYEDSENDGTDIYNAETQVLDLPDRDASKKTVGEETSSTGKGKEHTTDIYDATTQLINPVKDNEDSDTDEEGAFCSVNQIACASNKDAENNGADIYNAKTQILDFPDSEASNKTVDEKTSSTGKEKEEKIDDVYDATTQLINPVKNIEDSDTDEDGTFCSVNQKACASNEDAENNSADIYNAKTQILDFPDSKRSNKTVDEETCSTGKVKEEKVDDIYDATTQLINPVKNIEDSDTDEEGAFISVNQKACASGKGAENNCSDIYSAKTQILDFHDSEASSKPVDEERTCMGNGKREITDDIHNAATQLINHVKDNEDSDTDEEGLFRAAVSVQEKVKVDNANIQNFAGKKNGPQKCVESLSDPDLPTDSQSLLIDEDSGSSETLLKNDLQEPFTPMNIEEESTDSENLLKDYVPPSPLNVEDSSNDGKGGSCVSTTPDLPDLQPEPEPTDRCDSSTPDLPDGEKDQNSSTIPTLSTGVTETEVLRANNGESDNVSAACDMPEVKKLFCSREPESEGGEPSVPPDLIRDSGPSNKVDENRKDSGEDDPHNLTPESTNTAAPKFKEELDPDTLSNQQMLCKQTHKSKEIHDDIFDAPTQVLSRESVDTDYDDFCDAPTQKIKSGMSDTKVIDLKECVHNDSSLEEQPESSAELRIVQGRSESVTDTSSLHKASEVTSVAKCSKDLSDSSSLAGEAASNINEEELLDSQTQKRHVEMSSVIKEERRASKRRVLPHSLESDHGYKSFASQSSLLRGSEVTPKQNRKKGSSNSSSDPSQVPCILSSDEDIFDAPTQMYVEKPAVTNRENSASIKHSPSRTQPVTKRSESVASSPSIDKSPEITLNQNHTKGPSNSSSTSQASLSVSKKKVSFGGVTHHVHAETPSSNVLVDSAQDCRLECGGQADGSETQLNTRKAESDIDAAQVTNDLLKKDKFVDELTIEDESSDSSKCEDITIDDSSSHSPVSTEKPLILLREGPDTSVSAGGTSPVMQKSTRRNLSLSKSRRFSSRKLNIVTEKREQKHEAEVNTLKQDERKEKLQDNTTSNNSQNNGKMCKIFEAVPSANNQTEMRLKGVRGLKDTEINHGGPSQDSQEAKVTLQQVPAGTGTGHSTQNSPQKQQRKRNSEALSEEKFPEGPSQSCTTSKVTRMQLKRQVAVSQEEKEKKESSQSTQVTPKKEVVCMNLACSTAASPSSRVSRRKSLKIAESTPKKSNAILEIPETVPCIPATRASARQGRGKGGNPSEVMKSKQSSSVVCDSPLRKVSDQQRRADEEECENRQAVDDCELLTNSHKAKAFNIDEPPEENKQSIILKTEIKLETEKVNTKEEEEKIQNPEENKQSITLKAEIKLETEKVNTKEEEEKIQNPLSLKFTSGGRADTVLLTTPTKGRRASRRRKSPVEDQSPPCQNERKANESPEMIPSEKPVSVNAVCQSTSGLAPKTALEFKHSVEENSEHYGDERRGRLRKRNQTAKNAGNGASCETHESVGNPLKNVSGIKLEEAKSTRRGSTTIDSNETEIKVKTIEISKNDCSAGKRRGRRSQLITKEKASENKTEVKLEAAVIATKEESRGGEDGALMRPKRTRSVKKESQEQDNTEAVECTKNRRVSRLTRKLSTESLPHDEDLEVDKSEASYSQRSATRNLLPGSSRRESAESSASTSTPKCSRKRKTSTSVLNDSYTASQESNSSEGGERRSSRVRKQTWKVREGEGLRSIFSRTASPEREVSDEVFDNNTVVERNKSSSDSAVPSSSNPSKIDSVGSSIEMQVSKKPRTKRCSLSSTSENISEQPQCSGAGLNEKTHESSVLETDSHFDIVKKEVKSRRTSRKADAKESVDMTVESARKKDCTDVQEDINQRKCLRRRSVSPGKEIPPVKKPLIRGTGKGGKSKLDLEHIEEEAALDTSTSSSALTREGSAAESFSSDSGGNTKRRSRRVDAGISSPRTSPRKGASKQYRVVFSGYSDPAPLQSIVKRLGGCLVDSVDEANVLVTDKLRRTVKLLSMMGRGHPIVCPSWLTTSKRAERLQDPWNHLLSDKESEGKFNFTMKESLKKAANKPLLEDYCIFLTKNVKPPLEEMKVIVSSCGGKVLAKAPAVWPQNSVVISCQEDEAQYKKLKGNVTIVSSEWLLTGVLQQELDTTSYRLK